MQGLWIQRNQNALRELDLALLWEAPCFMNLAERLLLFSLAYSRAPERYVEIGTARGGSALIVNEAFRLLEKQGASPKGVCILDILWSRIID